MLRTCNVCFDKEGDKCLKCSFLMCNVCRKEWINGTCPQCKKEGTFVHKLDLTILELWEQPYILSVKRYIPNDNYIISLEKEWCWDKGREIEREKYYYSPFVRDCKGNIVGPPSNIVKVSKIPKKKRYLWCIKI